MSFAVEYRQGKKDSDRFEIIAYVVCTLVGCLVFGAIGVGVAIWNAQHKALDMDDRVVAEAPVKPVKAQSRRGGGEMTIGCLAATMQYSRSQHTIMRAVNGDEEAMATMIAMDAAGREACANVGRSRRSLD